MKGILITLLIVALNVTPGASFIHIPESDSYFHSMNSQDTMLKRQKLYNGIVWKNLYHGIDGDQYFLVDWFLPGEVSINGQTFENLKIRYDIYSDEIMAPLNLDEIVQLNKEMVDSFKLSFENKLYSFINIRDETTKGFTGYVNILYKGKSALFVKFRKEISHYITEKKFGSFYEIPQIYFKKDSLTYLIPTRRNFLKTLDAGNTQIRNFVRHNKLRISKKNPESFIPVIRYYDSMSR
jgi:hypothetical protein